MPEPWTLPFSPDAEWLEPDGRGGFASGTVAGERTRRYHALLLTANPAGRWVLVNGLEAWLEPTAGGGGDEPRSLSTQRYAGDVIHPRGRDRLVGFRTEPWPHWTFRWPDGLSIQQELLVIPGAALTLLRWRLVGGSGAATAETEATRWTLRVRPLLSGRDYHGLHRENASFNFNARIGGDHVVWQPYPGVPSTLAWSNGAYQQGPQWYRNFLYRAELTRGLDSIEDLASPGTFSWPLLGPGGDPEEEKPHAVLALAAGGFDASRLPAGGAGGGADEFFDTVAREEIFRRQRLVVPGAGALGRSADAYLIQSHAGGGRTIIAGYPWFTDWGRDTFIALRGLCFALGRLDEAGEILLRWAGTEQGGMLPNRFPDGGQPPEFNAVDASLWFVIAAHEYLALRGGDAAAPAGQAEALRKTSAAILEAYAAGTGRFGIGLDPADGLLRGGVGHPGVALTWMDAVVAGRPITPRAGKAVEIQALWLNALHLAGAADPKSRWRPLFEQGLVSFHARFWMPEVDRRFLRDVVDADGEPGANDERFRPNQIFAVGGLPLCLLPGDAACAVVAAVEERLWTPLGLRTLAPGEPGYAPRYEGGPAERDAAYHQGTAWPWLLGPFIEAWVRTHGGTAEAKRTARERFLRPLLERGSESALGHLPEIADAEPPHAPRGCPFQAWSVGEALRLDRVVLS